MRWTQKHRSAALAMTVLLGAATLPLSVLASPAMAAPAADTSAVTAPPADADYTNAVTPPMGWNNWAHYMCDIDEQLFRDQADAIVAKGLDKAGYDTVTVDDCWMQKDRDANGDLQTRAETFPSGMKALGDYIHSKGLKFGLYQDSGVVTCSGGDYAGSYGHFDEDMKLFAKFGVDYVKMDGCNVPSVAGETQEQTYKRIYFEEAEAIKNSGRPMVLSNSAPAYFSIPAKLPAWYSVMDWSGDMSQLWRESWDIDVYNTANPSTSRWPGIMRNYDYNKPIQRFASVGHWNDPDYIIGGNAGVSPVEARTQLSLWSMMASPLILSTDITAIPDSFLAELKHPGMLAIDQDPAGIQGTLVSSDGTAEVMYRPLSDGTFAVSLFNRSGASATVSTTAAKLGFATGGRYEVTNVWTGEKSTTTGDFSAVLGAHATELLRVKPVAGAAFGAASGQIMAPTESRCLDASAAAATAGAAVTLQNCNGSEAQRFVRGNNRSLHVLDKCATVGGDGIRGSDLVLEDCTGAENQSFGYKKNGQLISDSAALCVGTPGGAAATLDTCGDNPLHQIFSVPGDATSTVDALPAIPPSGTNWLSDLSWTSASVGYGVIGIDSGVKDNASDADVPLTANYTDPATGKKPVYAKGLGVHASSTVSYDLAGNCSAFSSDAFMQDPFTGTVVFSVWTDGEKRWISAPSGAGTAPQTVSLDVSGAKTLELHVDPPAGGNINGAHGDWGSPQVVCAEADTQLPVTTATFSGKPSASGWYTSATTLTLGATDNDKVASTEYRLNDGGWEVYAAPLALPEGESAMDFRSTDATGNREPAKSIIVKVDTQVPTVSAVVDADARTVTVVAADSGSGVASVEFSIDGGGTWQAYSAAIVAGDAGVSVSYRATDKAGLVAVSTVDAVVAPVETADPGAPSLSAPASVVAGAEFTVSAKDLVAGESYELWIHSAPVKLAVVKAGEDGTASVKVSVPAGFAAGAHELRLESGGSVVARTAMVVTAATVDPPVNETSKPSSSAGNNNNAGNNGSNNAGSSNAGQGNDLASTGAKVMLPAGIALLLVLGGGVALVITRRRRA
ncbi:NPCBM/NEW2 domain-containing protein [Arthrobacter sp.]|uniref:NPCBM/NEW2 domain-containing protein n=1 Tax=Arthrobacter sp. TaxID=1667 RepID=UPI0026DF5BAD|nr:NPCBM/NEW2 domain-containing protein [Arthrobacter sp.]MDO5753651.1 NPCBM/NEW2 domain-containing protein [Arthrobacter sp.]